MKQCMDNNDLHRRKKKSSDIVSGMALITEALIKPLQNLQKIQFICPLHQIFYTTGPEYS